MTLMKSAAPAGVAQDKPGVCNRSRKPGLGITVRSNPPSVWVLTRTHWQVMAAKQVDAHLEVWECVNPACRLNGCMVGFRLYLDDDVDGNTVKNVAAIDALLRSYGKKYERSSENKKGLENPEYCDRPPRASYLSACSLLSTLSDKTVKSG